MNSLTDDTPGTAPRQRKPRAPNAPPGVDRGQVKRPTSNAELVYRDIRQAIVSMALPPGAPIIERDLTARYGISRTPVREAVLRLAEERLLDVLPKSGTFVARIPLSLVREALVARRALEAVTVRAATERASESQILHLRAIIQHQQEMADAGNEEAFHRADEDFHAAICSAGRFPGIWDMIQQMRVHVDRYRRLTLPQAGRMQLVVKEHGAVVDAMARGEPELAADRMVEHLNKLQLDIAVFRDLWPAYFYIDPDLDDELLES